MTEWVAAAGGETESLWRQFLAYLFEQSSTGMVVPGVVAGLQVSATATPSTAVQVSPGLALVQESTMAGVTPLLSNATKTLDILTANPMTGTARNDLVVFDKTTGSIMTLIGTPNAIPSYPTPTASQVVLAGVTHAGSDTTIPTARIVKLATGTTLSGGADAGFKVHGVPMAGASTAKAGKRMHWGSFSGTTDSAGLIVVTHGAGFTPTSVVATTQTSGKTLAVGTFTATTFQVRAYAFDGGFLTGTAVNGFFFAGE